MQTGARSLVDVGPEGTSDVWPPGALAASPLGQRLGLCRRCLRPFPASTQPHRGSRPTPGTRSAPRPPRGRSPAGILLGARGHSVSPEREPEAGLGWNGRGGAQGPLRPPASRRWQTLTFPGCALFSRGPSAGSGTVSAPQTCAGTSLTAPHCPRAADQLAEAVCRDRGAEAAPGALRQDPGADADAAGEPQVRWGGAGRGGPGSRWRRDPHLASP